MDLERIKKDMEIIRSYAGNKVAIKIESNFYKCNCEFNDCYVLFLVDYERASTPYGISITPKNDKEARKIIKTLVSDEV